MLEGHDPAVALLRYVTEAGINVLVLGSCPKNCIMRCIFSCFLLFMDMGTSFYAWKGLHL